jgi:hypothetical protein
MPTEAVANVPVAALSAESLARVQEVEKDLGDVVVVAYQKPVVPAALKPKQVKRLRKAEEELGVCLVAYEAK